MGSRSKNENISNPQIVSNTNTNTIDLNNKRLPFLIAATTLYLDY